MRNAVVIVSLIALVTCQGAWAYEPTKPAKDVQGDDWLAVDAAPMQQWFGHIQPQFKEWSRCEYALLNSDNYGPEKRLIVSKKLRGDLERLLPSVAPGAKAYHVNIEYAKWFYTWRGFQQGLASAGDVPAQQITDAWAADCVKKYGS